jgi:hypothetical protein
MPKFADAAHSWMLGRGLREVSSNELWAGLEVAVPALTAKSESRKTPRATCMRDLRKDKRFRVARGRIALVELKLT